VLYLIGGFVWLREERTRTVDVLRELIQHCVILKEDRADSNSAPSAPVRGPPRLGERSLLPGVFSEHAVRSERDFHEHELSNGSTLSANIVQTNMLGFQWLTTATGGSTMSTQTALNARM